jgi:hypothetical protein
MSDVTVTTVTSNYDKSIPRDVDNQLALIAYTDTPFFTSIRKETTTQNGLVEKLEDSLADAAENAQIEGADVTTATVAAPAVVSNRVQRFQKEFKISKDLEKVKKYARKSEINRIQGLKTKELARDIEYAMLNSTIVTGTAAVAAKMNGIKAFAAAAATYDFDETPAATNHITEDILLDVMQVLFENGAKPDTVLAPPAQKRKISAFSDKGRVTVNADASAKKLTMIVNILETDFGVVAVVPELFNAPDVSGEVSYDACTVYDSKRVACKTFRPLEREELAKTGDARKFYMTTSKTVLPDSAKVVGLIKNLTRVKVSS